MTVKRKINADAGCCKSKKSRIETEAPSERHWSLGEVDGDDYNKEIGPSIGQTRRSYRYVCPDEGCGQRFSRPCHLEDHVRSHNKERPFLCTQIGCDKTFPRKDHLTRHIKNAHSGRDPEKTHVCDWTGCNKSFDTNSKLRRHREAHGNKIHCTGYFPCYQSFRKLETLAAHVRTAHLDEKAYLCTFIDTETGEACMAAYNQTHSLLRHVQLKHTAKKPEPQYFCTLCTDPNSKSRDYEVVVEGEESKNVGPLIFATKNELESHIKQKHPPMCSNCGQKFTTTSNLNVHFKTKHGKTESRPKFPCLEIGCGGVFDRKSNLSTHVQTVHEKQLRFFCTSECMVKSKHEELKTWSGENACGVRFKSKSSLDQHIRTHHLGLGTRKEARKAAKVQNLKKKPNPSMLTLLTGVGYEQGRDIRCLFEACGFRFYRNVDLRRHLCAEHEASEDEAVEMLRERDAVSGGRFWLRGIEQYAYPDNSATPSMPQTPMPDSIDGFNLFTFGVGEQIKPLPSVLGHDFNDMSILDEEAEMDMAMGLERLV